MPTTPRRFAGATLALLSALLCTAVAVAWATAALGDRVWLRFARHSIILFAADGPYIAAAEGYFFSPQPHMNDPTYEGPGGLLRLLRTRRLGTRVAAFAGVEFHRDASGPVSQFRALIVPAAYPVALLAVYPLVWALRQRRAGHRAKHGACARCGYDLTGNVSGACPECGTRMSPPPSPV